MSINCQAIPCPVIVKSSCVFYEGPNLVCLGINTNQTLETALEKINSLFCQVLENQETNGTSGTSGTSGISGSSGINGTSGSSGSNGSSGQSGTSGTSGIKGDQYRTVSETCFTLGDTGTIVVEPGLAYTPGQDIVISYDALNYQISTVLIYNSVTGELTFSLPTTVVGTVTEYCQWDVNLNGAAGGDGSDGTSGTSGSTGTDGTSGSSGLTCTSLEVTNIAPTPKTYEYTNCAGELIFVDIPSEQFISICATSWVIDEGTFNILNNGVCSGTSGTSGTSGGGGGESTCPDHFKLAAVSGAFTSNGPNSPAIKNMYSGNNNIGWSYGLYNLPTSADGFGNLISVKYSDSYVGIPLPIDLNIGDTIRISGIAYLSLTEIDPINPKFYITVSRFNCSDVTQKNPNTPLYTVIPVASYEVSLDTGKVCFLESITLSSVLPSNETFFVVGLCIGSDDDPTVDINARFSYTLDVEQACIGAGQNLLIRNCCDPAYTNVIVNNLVPIGESFVDTDGNCWTVEALTTDPVTAERTFANQYNDCEVCIESNPCPQNFVIQSCCGGGEEVFSAALIGVGVGDTFVDTNGFCWSAIDNTPDPITNVVEVATVYPITSCEDAVCTDLNTCPTPVRITSCCRDSLVGYTTLEILQAALPGIAVGDIFVDTFGMCWDIRDSGYTFPNSSFIVPVTNYGIESCEECTIANQCPIDFYYTVQNCCTEEIEVLLLPAVYPVDSVLSILFDAGLGCYRVLSWSDTGTPTSNVVSVLAVNKSCKECTANQSLAYEEYCPGRVLCCITYQNLSVTNESGTITGYRCDGTWIQDFTLLAEETICMAQVFSSSEFITKVEGCCSFDVLNPSLVDSIDVTYTTCGAGGGAATIPPNTLLSSIVETCVQCVRMDGPGKFEYTNLCD